MLPMMFDLDIGGKMRSSLVITAVFNMVRLNELICLYKNLAKIIINIETLKKIYLLSILKNN